MNSQAQLLLTNLRLLGALPQGQWIITERINGILNICGFCCNSVYNNIKLSFTMDGWQSTQECLKSIYCDRLPKLVETLIDDEDSHNLFNIYKLLEGSLEGLNNISNIYDDKLIATHIETIKEDFAKSLLVKIKHYLDESSDLDEEEDCNSDSECTFDQEQEDD